MRFASLLLIGCLGCGDDTATGGNGGAGNGGGGEGGANGGQGPGGAGDCPSHTASADPDFEATEGLFILHKGDGFADFRGSVHSPPSAGFQTEDAREGQCRLLTFSASNCTPECDLGAFCIDSECVTPTAALDAGTVTITGLLDTPAVADDSGIGIYYWSSDVAGPFADSATVTSTGGDVGPFELSTCLPEPMSPTADWSQQMTDRAPGESVTLSWDNPLPGARIYIRMTTGVGTHGGISPTEIECEGPDTGELTLPGAYLDQLFSDGWSCGECGDNQLERYYSADADVPVGKVRLRGAAFTIFYFHPFG